MSHEKGLWPKHTWARAPPGRRLEDTFPRERPAASKRAKFNTLARREPRCDAKGRLGALVEDAKKCDDSDEDESGETH